MKTKKTEEAIQTEWNVRAKYPGRDKLEQNQVLILAACFARIRPDLPPHGIALDAGRMLAIGRMLQSLGVARCNYGLTPRQEKRDENLEKEAQRIAAFYGLKARAGGDPRGYVLNLSGEGLPRSGWDDSFGIG